jgi:hypothetical protein
MMSDKQKQHQGLLWSERRNERRPRIGPLLEAWKLMDPADLSEFILCGIFNIIFIISSHISTSLGSLLFPSISE